LSSDEFRESAALYAVGALDAVTVRRFEKYLRTATEAERREVSELIEIAAMLPLALAESPVPAHLKRLLLADLALENARQENALTRQPAELSSARRLLIAATVILALGCGFLFWQNRELASERNQLAAQLQTSTQQLASVNRQWEEVMAPATRVISLSGAAAPEASAKLVWDTKQAHWVLYLYNLPALPADKDYQLWYLTADQRPVSAAVFRTDAQGRGELRLSVPSSIIPRLAATAVSLEPKGGSPQPTGQIFLKGTV
jgi:anti-sigma-K factor RskA